MVLGIVYLSSPNTVYAESGSNNYDKTNVLDDLKSSKDFDILKYPYDEKKDIQVINFVEYCYSFKANMRSNYGLYIYVYNPKGLNLSTSEKMNKVQMATKYGDDGKPTDYTKFSLEFLNKSEDEPYKNLFYKFKVIDKKIDGTTFADIVNSLQRRYDVSGLELATYGNFTATDYPVNGTYLFTGYAEGYGADSNSKCTLSSTVEYLETANLDVKHTFYRTKTSSKGAGYQNQLDTVYFAVPKRFFNSYGKLQKIKAEWFEYKTTDIIVTSNQDFYDKAKPYLGIQTGPYDKFGMTEYNPEIGISLSQNAVDANGMKAASWGWNLGSGYFHTPAPSIQYLFKVNDIKEYDPYADIVDNGGVKSNALYEYIKKYDNTFNKGKLPIKNGSISADLFASDIDDYRKLDTKYGKIQNGYSYYDFDADVDLQTLSSWQDTDPSFWDNWINWGLWDAMTGNIPKEESRTVSPIYTLKESDLTGSDADIANKLMINSKDVQNLKNFYKEAVTVTGKDDEEKVVVLFRFATSDYYSAPVEITELGKGFLGNDKFTKGQAYRAKESVFFDFDIIQLSFQKDGKYTVIPVVSSPIDIVNDITPPVDMPDMEWWQILLAVILLIILVLLLCPILPSIIKGVWWVITLPFKLIKSFFKPKTNGKSKEG